MKIKLSGDSDSTKVVLRNILFHLYVSGLFKCLVGEKKKKRKNFGERDWESEWGRWRKSETTPSCPGEKRGFRHFWWLCGCLSALWEFLAGKQLFPLIPVFCCEIGSSSAAAVRHAALRLLSVLHCAVEFLFLSCCFFIFYISEFTSCV